MSSYTPIYSKGKTPDTYIYYSRELVNGRWKDVGREIPKELAEEEITVDEIRARLADFKMVESSDDEEDSDEEDAEESDEQDRPFFLEESDGSGHEDKEPEVID